jgi:hypothetical protein
VLNGRSRKQIQAMLRIVSNGYSWLVLFLVLTALDLVAIVWLVDHI